MAVCEVIDTQTLTGDTATVTFSSIPATYRHLMLRMSVKSTQNTAAGYDWIGLTYNASSGGTAYSTNTMSGYTTSTPAGDIEVGQAKTKLWAAADLDDAAELFTPIAVDILDYASGDKNQTTMGWGGTIDASIGLNAFGGGVYDSVTAISQITLDPGAGDFVSGSEFTLYGLKDA